MRIKASIAIRMALLVSLMVSATVLSTRLQADTGTCGGQNITLPFTDVAAANIFFCSIAQIYFQGITQGTAPTTYSPSGNVTREQMAAFLSRVQNSGLKRGSRRAALNQFWTTKPQYAVPQGIGHLGTTAVGFNSSPRLVASDGADLWVADANGNTVSRVRAGDGKLLEVWTGATGAFGVLVAMGRVFVTGATEPGSLYMIDPSQPYGAVTTLSSALGANPVGIAFDGQRIWTANVGTTSGSVSRITPGSPFTVTNDPDFAPLVGILYDGANIWVTESGSPGSLKKLDARGAVISTVTVGDNPYFPIYDGTNIWVPNNNSNSVSVVRPTDGLVLATLTGNGLNGPTSAAFDGQRVLVTNNVDNSVSLFWAADFSPLGTFSTGAGSQPGGACSDGLNFWIALQGQGLLARY